jgi:ATP-dependent exoDNAse (exonuclease V) beta subunit
VEIEEELSIRNYGNLVHFALENLYQDWKGKKITEDFFENKENKIEKSIDHAIEELKQQPEFYDKGMNYIHLQLAKKVIHQIVEYDLQLIKEGNSLEIIDLEYHFDKVDFSINENEKVAFNGYIDRIDKLNGTLRIIDYKTAKTEGLKIKIEDKSKEDFFFNSDKKQALQLCIYQHVVENLSAFKNQKIETAIWSFEDVKKGPVSVFFDKGTLEDAMVSVKNIILEILNPEIKFIAKN